MLLLIFFVQRETSGRVVCVSLEHNKKVCVVRVLAGMSIERDRREWDDLRT
jgi:hypothetical protein